MDRLHERDPLLLYERRLRSEGLQEDALWSQMRAEVEREVDAAERFAEAAAWPDGEQALLDV